MFAGRNSVYKCDEFNNTNIVDFLDGYDEQVTHLDLDQQLELPFNQHTVSSLKQRLANPKCQVSYLEYQILFCRSFILFRKLVAKPLDLHSKRSKRCKECRKYVVKSEILALAVPPFKMDLMLMSFIPKISIIQVIHKGSEGDLIIGMTNPFTSNNKVHIKPLEDLNDIHQFSAQVLQSLSFYCGFFRLLILMKNLI